MKYKNWTIESIHDGEEQCFACSHDTSDDSIPPYVLYDMTIEEVKEWIDEQNEFANEAVTNV